MDEGAQIRTDILLQSDGMHLEILAEGRRFCSLRCCGWKAFSMRTENSCGRKRCCMGMGVNNFFRLSCQMAKALRISFKDLRIFRWKTKFVRTSYFGVDRRCYTTGRA